MELLLLITALIPRAGVARPLVLKTAAVEEGQPAAEQHNTAAIWRGPRLSSAPDDRYDDTEVVGIDNKQGEARERPQWIR